MKSSTLFVLFALVGGQSLPAEQTSQQRALFAEHRARAQAQSALATPKVLEFFDSTLVRETLRHCCEDLADEPAESLLRRYRAEARASEIAHAFPATSIGAMWPDVTIDEVHKEPWFLNEWQAGLLQHSNFSGGPKAVNDLTQQQIYGCRPFAGSGPTWKEAAERLIYIAHNMLRLDFGSLPGFGDVTAMFNTTLVRDMVLISPHDTGQYGMACLHEGVPGNFTPPPLNCSAWPGQVLGTMDHLDHLILPNLYMAYNTSATLPFPFNASGNRSVRNSIRALFQRSAISKVAYEDIPPVDFWASFQFLEVASKRSLALPRAEHCSDWLRTAPGLSFGQLGATCRSHPSRWSTLPRLQIGALQTPPMQPTSPTLPFLQGLRPRLRRSGPRLRRHAPPVTSRRQTWRKRGLCSAQGRCGWRH